jgi:hypothetical protein
LTGRTYPAEAPIPPEAIHPFARKVLADLPAPTNSGVANNYQILQTFRNNSNKFGSKLDFQMSPGLDAFVRFGQRKANLTDEPSIPLPSGGDGNGRSRILNRQLAMGLSYAPSSAQLIEFRFGASRSQGGKAPAAIGTPGALEAYGISGLPTDERVSGGLPTQTIPGYTDLGRQPTSPQWQNPTVLNPKFNYSIVVGRQTLQTGFEFQRVHTEVQDVNPLYGRDTYAGRFSGDNFADFLFGLRSAYALSNLFVANLRQHMYFAYLQDDVSISEKISLNAGLRYEYATPQWERDHKLTNFDPLSRTLLKANDGPIEARALVRPDRNNWGPRLGLAYSITPRAVIRSGVGVSYVHFHRAGAANLLPINGPQVVNAVINQRPGDAAFRTTQEGYPANLAEPANFDPQRANITYIPRDARTSYVTSWFLSVQRQFGGNTVLDLAYVGNRSNKLLLFANMNQAVPNQPGQNLSLAQRRPIPNFGDITIAFNGGFSNYNSFQARFEHRLDRGLSILNSFTWSKTIDNGAGSLESPNGNFPSPQDYYNRQAEKALSGYDQPLNNTTSIVYSLPSGLGPFLEDWQFSFINTMNSGAPVTFTYQPDPTVVVSGIQQDFRGANNYRPHVTGNPILPDDVRTVSNRFDRNAVVIPSGPSPFGSVGRNTVRSDAFYQLDFSASKKFDLPRDEMTLQVRAEFFNLFNKTNFLAPNANRSAAGFGAITGAYDPRLIQLAVKLNF